MDDVERGRALAVHHPVCLALDHWVVVVNVRDVTAATSEGADTLSRNCQLTEGERGLLQPKRQVDVLDPEVRRLFQAQQGADE